MRHSKLLTVVAAMVGLATATPVSGSRYSWRDPAAPPADTIAQRIAPPPGFVRVDVAPASFGAWLRNLPLKPAGAAVLLYNGAPKLCQNVHVAVVDIDVGRRDLQQCADAVMRLRGEWLFASGRAHEIAFNDTGSAKPIAFSRWAQGERPHAAGRLLVWTRDTKPDAGYASFRRYMDAVFTWAGTYSLERELRPVPIGEVAPGDVFIKGGFPGHAVLVADVATNHATGEKRFLLLQSFMPAQEMHILKNPASDTGSPWYNSDFGDQLVTPEWVFARESLRGWR